jgi:hypothetical protein
VTRVLEIAADRVSPMALTKRPVRGYGVVAFIVGPGVTFTGVEAIVGSR